MPRISVEYRRAQQDRILDAAEACFARDGIENVRIEDIAGERGMSVGALYRYFPSRDDIIAAVGARHLERDRQAMEALYRRELPLHGYLYESLHYFLVRPAVVALSEAAARARDGGQVAGFEEWAAWLTVRYGELQRAGLVRTDIPASKVARHLILTYEGLAVLLSISNADDPEDLIRAVATTLADGLAPRPFER